MPAPFHSASIPPLALGTESGWSGGFWILFQGRWALGQKRLAWASRDGSRELKRERAREDTGWDGDGDGTTWSWGTHRPAVCLGSFPGELSTSIAPHSSRSLLCGPLGAPGFPFHYFASLPPTQAHPPK